jgi:hypothetical protein
MADQSRMLHDIHSSLIARLMKCTLAPLLETYGKLNDLFIKGGWGIKTIWITNFSSGPGINSQTPQQIGVATLC